MPKTLKKLPKFQRIAQSGHTGSEFSQDLLNFMVPSSRTKSLMDNDEYECMATPKPLLLRRHIFCEAIKINILKGSTVGIVHARLLPFVETKFGDFLFSLESYSHFI